MSEERWSIRWLDPADLQFDRTPGGVLRLHLSDRSYPRITALRAFPLSQADQFVSLRSGDEEIGVLPNLDGLAPDQRDLLLAELDRRYFRPLILKVLKLTDQGGQWRWSVDTDHGPVEFTSVHPRQSAARLAPDRWVVTDVDNNRYEIRDLQHMDRLTRSKLMVLIG